MQNLLLSLPEIPQFTLDKADQMVVLVENHPLLGLVISRQFISDLDAVLPEITTSQLDIVLRLRGSAWLGTKRHDIPASSQGRLPLEDLVAMVRRTMELWHFRAHTGEGGHSTHKVMTGALGAPFAHVLCTKVELIKSKAGDEAQAVACHVESLRSDFTAARRERK